MYQQEIKFFWPLTEQIPLDLDYSGCVKQKDTITISSSTIVSTYGSAGTTWSTYITTDKLETEEITFTLNKKPGIIRRLAYNFLGVKWKTK